MIRVNHQIRAPRIRVVLEDGAMLGIYAPHEALREAERRGLDLVEISPKANPPVCKLMDYGKYKYELKKKSHSGKKAASSVVKEVSLSPATDVHDLNFKMRNSIGFLEEGHRVKVTIRFRGREMAHPEIGHKQMEKVVEALKFNGAVEGPIKMEGKMLVATFIPLTPAQRKQLQRGAEEGAKKVSLSSSAKKQA